MSYSEEEKKDILSKVLKITIAEAARMKEGFAPDILIEPVLAKAREIIEKYENDPEVDIWWNARLDKYTTWTIHNIMMENYEEYTLNEENLEAVNALIEAEEMLGENATDEELEDLFDYTPEELARLRILAKYVGGIDREAAFREFSKML